MPIPPPDPNMSQTPTSSNDTAAPFSSPSVANSRTAPKTEDFYSFFTILSRGIASPAQIEEYIEKGNPLQFIDEFGRCFPLPSSDPSCTREAALIDLVKLTHLFLERWALENFDDPIHPDDIIFERKVYGVPKDKIPALQALRGELPTEAGYSPTDESLKAGSARQMRKDHEIWSITAALIHYLLLTNSHLKGVVFDKLDQHHEHGLGTLIKILKSRTALKTDEETISKHLRKAIEMYKQQHSSTSKS
jgi:hypothetical protein